jgi:cell division protein DivIC
MQPFNKDRVTTSSIQSYQTKSSHSTVDINRKKRHRRLRLLGLLLVAFLIWVGSLWMEQDKLLQAKQAELESIKLKVQEANKEQEELTYQIKRLHDKDYIAEVARRDYFLSRPGEMIFKVPKK